MKPSALKEPDQAWASGEKIQIPPELVVKSQAIDITEVIFVVGLAVAGCVSTGNQGLSGLHSMRPSVYH